MRTVLDFGKKTTTIDGLSCPMLAKDAFDRQIEKRRKVMRNLAIAKKEQRNLCPQAKMKTQQEPTATQEATARLEGIQDAACEKADLPELVENHCNHLTALQRRQLLKLLEKNEDLFDGSLGDWKTETTALELKKGLEPFHAMCAFPVPQMYLGTLKREVDGLVQLKVSQRQPDSEWASNAFIFPKKNNQVRLVSNFREVNKLLVQKPHPIPKISTTLQEMEGFTCATQLDLNMGYCAIRLNPDAQKICTIILPWGKYSYLRLPMQISGAPDIFQEKMGGLMEELEYVRACLDDLLVILRDSFDDHSFKLEKVSRKLSEAGLKINAAKSTFGKTKVEYIGYILTCKGIKPQPEKASAILAIQQPKNIRELRRFLSLVQYYQDMWSQRSHMFVGRSKYCSREA